MRWSLDEYSQLRAHAHVRYSIASNSESHTWPPRRAQIWPAAARVDISMAVITTGEPSVCTCNGMEGAPWSRSG